jgi:hypothetical protein
MEMAMLSSLVTGISSAVKLKWSVDILNTISLLFMNNASF